MVFHMCLDSGSNFHPPRYYDYHDHQMFVRASGKCATFIYALKLFRFNKHSICYVKVVNKMK